MIYSKRLNTNIPIQVYANTQYIQGFGKFIHYQVKDKCIPVGYVDLKDTPKGAYVLFIKNQNPDLYSGFGLIADQIEVEHCLNKGIRQPEIMSEAALSSHIQHYKRGKRFVDKWVNKLVKVLVRQNEIIDTSFIGAVKMFMPKSMVKKYIGIIKKDPLLSGIK